MKVELLDIRDITVPENRQRKDNADEHIKKLADSIIENGLIHAITVDREGKLVAGWCRFHAIKSLTTDYIYGSTKIAPGTIPVVYTHKVSPRDLQLIELEENIRRKDLSPIDKAQAIASLHNIRKHDNPEQTVRQTAVELAEMRDKKDTTAKAEEREISDALLLSNFVDDADVRAAKTKKDALRIARKKLENNLLATLGSSIGGDASTFRNNQEIHTGDALRELENLPDDSCDILLFDPPYGMGAHSFGEQTSVEGHEYEDTPEYSQSLIGGIIAASDRVLKDTACIFMFCDIRFWREFSSLLEEHGWYVWKTPLIWDKGSMGHCPRPGFGPKRSYEAIVYAFRGEYRTLKTGSDVLRFSAVGDKSHAAEKPVDLLKELLSWGALAGAVVLDPTCGSGSTLVAAHELNMAAIGIEKSEKFANIARARLAQAATGEKEEEVHPLDTLFS